MSGSNFKRIPAVFSFHDLKVGELQRAIDGYWVQMHELANMVGLSTLDLWKKHHELCDRTSLISECAKLLAISRTDLVTRFNLRSDANDRGIHSLIDRTLDEYFSGQAEIQGRFALPFESEAATRLAASLPQLVDQRRQELRTGLYEVAKKDRRYPDYPTRDFRYPARINLVHKDAESALFFSCVEVDGTYDEVLTANGETHEQITSLGFVQSFIVCGYGVDLYVPKGWARDVLVAEGKLGKTEFNF